MIRILSLLSVVHLASCAAAEAPPDDPDGGTWEDLAGGSPAPCTPPQDAPYATGIPYLGIHADAGNSDVIACATASEFRPAWHALIGHGLVQPNTFSPDGRTLYATTTAPTPDGPRLHALDAATGQIIWQQSLPPTVSGGSVEVDAQGHLYLAVESSILSLTADGVQRWRTTFEDQARGADATWGLHFTPDGHLATVTAAGMVALLDRTTGAVLATLSIPEAWGFVPPTSLADSMQLDLTAVLPEAVQQDILHVWGEEGLSNGSGGISSFLGAGGFVDNTVGIAPNGDIYVVGGGPNEKSGALVQVRVHGTAEAPTLSPGWHAVLDGHSATTPSISADGRWVVIGDGSVMAALIGDASGSVKAYDTRVCAGVVGAACEPAWQESLQRWPLPGAPAIARTGTVIFYEMALGQPGGLQARDLVAVGPTGIQWETTLPDGLDWTSVVTVSDNHIIGTASRIVPSAEQLLSVGFPSTVDDYLVVLDRRSGGLRWKAAIPDDSAATVTIGPDGALYVGMLGLLSVMSLDKRPTLGLMKFSPTAGPDEGHALPPGPTPVEPASPTPEVGGLDGPTPDAPDAPRGAEPGTGDADPACFALDIDAQPTCCEDGPAHCVPDSSIPASFHDRLERCDEGTLCVPDSILASEHRIAPPPCASIGGAEGACVSICVPAVGEMAALLPSEGCSADEVCVPCISPLDNQPTGVCGVIECGGNDPTGDDPPETVEGDEEPESDVETDPADPADSNDEPRPEGAISCCGGAGTCLLADIVPEGQRGSVKHCGQEGHRDLLCVPNEFLDPTWTPQACHGTSLMQNEYDGVCLPECLRLPLQFALDRRPCQEGFACTPCLNPLTGQPSGAPGC